MRHGSLFSGVGGFDIAAAHKGWQNVFHCEIDAKSQAVLKKRFPEARLFTDVRDIYRFADEYDGDEDVRWCERHNADFADCACVGCSEWDDEIGVIDVLTAGFPCQPFSMNGKREGKNDERNLWPETIRIIRHTRPRWFVGENVSGIVSWNDGEIFSEIISDLRKEGYEVWPCNIPALSVAAEHKRERIWFIAHNPSVGVQGMWASGKQVSYPLERTLLPLRNRNRQWEVEPDLRRANDGLSGKMDRLKQLGNAIVPQIAIQIFDTIELYELL